MNPAHLVVSTADVGHPTNEPPCAWPADDGGGTPRCGRAPATDRQRLDAALETLRRYGITVAAAEPGGPDQIADRLAQRIRARFPFADGACVFWTAEADGRCFSPSGRLLAPLTVHAYGPGTVEAAVAALERAGLAVGPEGRAPVVADRGFVPCAE